MITAKGKSVSGGIAIGPVRWHRGEERIAAAEWAEDRERELIRLEKARTLRFCVSRDCMSGV